MSNCKTAKIISPKLAEKVLLQQQVTLDDQVIPLSSDMGNQGALKIELLQALEYFKDPNKYKIEIAADSQEEVVQPQNVRPGTKRRFTEADISNNNPPVQQFKKPEPSQNK